MSSLSLIRRRALSIALTLLALGVASSAQAQWTIRANVGQGNFVKMMDEIALPNVGYIGTATGGLLRTTNGGYTWTKVTGNGVEQIYDIAFKNQQIGICVGQIYTYKTTDGGLSWTQLNNVQGRAIHYILTRDMFVIASWSTASQASTNDGATWQAFSASEMNGFAYLDANHVLFTPHSGQAKFTTDGGASWETSNMSAEIYQPTAIRSRGWYIGVSEFNGSVWRTKDGGFNWEIASYINNSSGCMRGTDDNLIVQTLSGMVRSTDFGDTWQYICGPDLTYDTRFWVRGKEIFALSSSGQFYYNPTSSASDDSLKIYISPNPQDLYTDGCSPAFAKVRISTNACSAQLTQVTIEGDDELQLDHPTIPADLKSSTTVPVKYAPTDADENGDSALVKVTLNVGGLIIDTFFKVYGHIQTMINPAASPAQIGLSMSPIDCQTDKAQTYIQNLGCDDFTIDSMKLSDPLHFSVAPMNFPVTVQGQKSVGIMISSNAVNVKKSTATLLVYVSNSAGYRTLQVDLELNRIGPVLKPMDDRRFVFNTTCEPQTGSVNFTNLTCDTVIVDSVEISNPALFELLPLSVPKALIKDESLTIPFRVIAPRGDPSSARVTVYLHTLGAPLQQVAYLFTNTVVQMVLPDDTVKFTAEGTCPEFASDFDVSNILCDPIRIISMKPLFQPAFTVTLPKLPLELKTNETATIGIATNTFFKGTTGTSIAVRYEAYGKLYDTIIHVTVRSLKSFSIDPKLQKLDFGRVSVCAPQRRTVYIENKYCLPISIESINLSAQTSNRFSVISLPAPKQLLAPGERDSVVLQFAPDAIGSRIGALQVHLKSAVVSLDTFFTIEGIGTGSVNANIRDAELAMGEALTCEHLEESTVVRNDGCVDLTITSVSPNNAQFSLTSPSLPYTIKSGDSITLTFEPSSNAAGAYNQKVIVRLLSAQNVEQLVDCELTATIIGEAERLIAPPMSLGKLNACVSFDTSITISNPLQCATLDVTATLSSPDALIVGTNQATLAPGGSHTFDIHMEPNTATTCDLRLRALNIDTTIPFTYAFTGGDGEMTMSGRTSTLKTNACDPVFDTIRITNNDCGGSAIATLRIVPTGGTTSRFSFIGMPDLPYDMASGSTLAVAIAYDPQTVGVNDAMVEAMTSSGTILTYALHGDFTPVGILDASLTSSGMQQIVVGDEFDVDVDMAMAVPQPISINDLYASFSYDGDLLTLLSVTPKGEWLLVEKEEESAEAELHFSNPVALTGQTVPLATLHFRTNIAKEKTGTVKLDALLINPNDDRFNNCVARTMFHTSANDVALTYFCGGETLRGMLNGELPVSNIVVQPHPASTSDHSMRVSFDMARDAEVDVELVNVLGVTTSSLHTNATVGHHELQLSLEHASKGWHLLRIRTQYGTAGIRVLIND